MTATQVPTPLADRVADPAGERSKGQRNERPALGFLGLGWIGRARLRAITASGQASVAALIDPDPAARSAAAEQHPSAARLPSLAALWSRDRARPALDGLVIATPSAQHAEQAIAALEHGLPVFCQKPLARNAAEARAVVEAARRRNLPLGVDLSYRHTRAMQAIAATIRTGTLGRIHAIRLTFHNAYGPDRPWFYRKQEAGGGCLIDLGVHLVDLAMWVLGFPELVAVRSCLRHEGERLTAAAQACEDYAVAQLELADGCVVQLACSWRAPAGCDALIEASFHGTRGGATLRNVAGSFYEFVAEQHEATRTTVLVGPDDDTPDAWGAGAALSWLAQVRARRGFDPAAADYVHVAEILDAIYANNTSRTGDGPLPCTY